MDRLDIAVVGTGTAGSATALFLARAGHRVTVYERVAAPTAAGAGIMLQPTGMAVLAELGLVEQVVARGAHLSGLWCQTPDGRPIIDLAYSDLASDLYGVGLHRGVLFQALFDAVRAQPGLHLELGVDVEDLADAPGGHWVVERGTRRRWGPHQLVVVANGARSSLRDDTAFAKSVEPYPWGALWAVVPDPERRFHTRLFQVVRGTRQLIGLLPTGLGPTGDTPLVSLFYSLRTDRWDEFGRCDFAAWKAAVAADAPAAAPVLDQLASPADLLFSEYHDVSMWPWNTERVVYIGDAAHAMSPQLGQGANLALLDALVLSQCVARHQAVPDALFEYSRLRRHHLGWYEFITRALTPFFQSDLTWLGPLRDLGLRLVGTVPLGRATMVAAMAGVSLGPLLPTLPLRHRPPRR